MSKVNEVANLALQKLSSSGDTQAALDPATIAILIEAIIAVFEMIKECRQDADGAVEMVRNPTRLQKVAVNMNLRRQMGLREFRQQGRQMTNALIEIGPELSPEDIVDLYNEV